MANRDDQLPPAVALSSVSLAAFEFGQVNRLRRMPAEKTVLDLAPRTVSAEGDGSGSQPGAYTGVLNIAKPVGITSHDVVARVRRVAGQPSVGHAGTLDPLASGVLIVLLGKATALSAYAMATTKTYEAGISFGRATATDDAEGETIRSAPVPSLTSAALRSVLERFTGDVDQIPPQFSAIKKEGKRAYVAARSGKPVALEPRRVTIQSIDLLDWEPPILRVRVTCGSGTYIRSLARDLGEALDSAAHLATLIRTVSGDFRLEDALPLDLLTPDSLAQFLQPAQAAVTSLRCFTLDEDDLSRIRHGNPITGGLVPTRPDEVISLASAGGRLVGLARPIAGGWRPIRVLDPAS